MSVNFCERSLVYFCFVVFSGGNLCLTGVLLPIMETSTKRRKSQERILDYHGMLEALHLPPKVAKKYGSSTVALFTHYVVKYLLRTCEAQGTVADLL